ncbi:MAG: hypothetical protein ACTHMM_00775 [Agriterribacter sp.]
MPHIALLLIFILISTLQAPAQNFLVSNTSENIFYLRAQNPVSVVVDGAACSSLVIKTDNGTVSSVTQGDFFCNCTIIPERPGIATVTVYKKSQSKLKKVGIMAFRVRSLPLPEAMIGNIGGPFCRKKVLIAMGGVRVIQTNSNICAAYSVQSYKTTLIRNDSIIAQVTNLGAVYNEELLKHLQNIEINDQVIISDIVIMYYDGDPMALQKQLIYTITE